MSVTVQGIRCVLFAFVILDGISSFNVAGERHVIANSDAKPLVKEQFSINSSGNNESIVSREVINHVRHQHQQTVGNVHILTNIDIANLITILNESASTDGQTADATTAPLTTKTTFGKL